MSEAMRIRWQGHSCFEFFGPKNSVITDPHDGKSIGIKPPISNADIVLVSHDHFDHNATRMIKNEHSTIISQTGKHEVKGTVFEGLPSFHDDQQGALRGSNIIYKFKMDGINICHCGDLGDTPSEDVIKAIRKVDILFIPVGEIYTLSIPLLKDFIRRVEPKIVVPMHYRVGGITLPLKTVDDFLNGIPKDNILYVGNEVELSTDELDEFLGVWVFDR